MNLSKSTKENLTRNNHYVPQWYQKGFVIKGEQLIYLDLCPNQKILKDGRVIKFNERKSLPFSKCFCEYDLYTTYFGNVISDDIEKKIFGKIDDSGAKAIRAFITADPLEQHEHFIDFFLYIDAQKLRTPKGLNWLRTQYNTLTQEDLMIEMNILQSMHCATWLEGTREIVSAKDSETKFIISDHPITIYNYACPPTNKYCKYPNDPSVTMTASQTLFPLSKDYCLILTNYEYAISPNSIDPLQKRTNARNFGETLVRTDALLRDRKLNDKEIREINYVIKHRARRYVAGGKEEWLYPEKYGEIIWEDIQKTLLPPSNKIHEFGGELFAGFDSGKTYYQDAFGRTTQDSNILVKEIPKEEPSLNDYCPCGQGRLYEKCCKNKEFTKRAAWDEYSIRERNLIFYNGMRDILGLNEDKNWDDVRKEISDEQIKYIYTLYSDLWPPHTDLIKLLPKPDGVCRALYMGIVDPRTISNYATSLVLYFDEIIIQNPFVNPSGIAADYNPIENPAQFKQETLKYIILYDELYPFICSGTINLIPDITVFNKQLRIQLIEFGKQNSKDNINIVEKEREFMEKLAIDDFKRANWALSEQEQINQFRRTAPDASEEFIHRMFELSQKMRSEDPFSLLQDNVYANGGQISFSNLSPAPTLAIFLAQLTGAHIITDSPTRFSQIVRKFEGKETSRVNLLYELIESIQYPFNILPTTVFQLREQGYADKMLTIWQDISESLFSDSEKVIDTEYIRRELVDSSKYLIQILSEDSFVLSKEYTQYSFNAKFQIGLPSRSVLKSVMRLFVISNTSDRAKKLPIVIYVE